MKQRFSVKFIVMDYGYKASFHVTEEWQDHPKGRPTPEAAIIAAFADLNARLGQQDVNWVERDDRVRALYRLCYRSGISAEALQKERERQEG